MIKKIINGVKNALRLSAVIGCLALVNNCDSMDSALCLYKARETYPNAVLLPGNKYKFVALDRKGSVHYIEVMGKLSDGITKDIVVINAQDGR